MKKRQSKYKKFWDSLFIDQKALCLISLYGEDVFKKSVSVTPKIMREVYNHVNNLP